MKIGDLPFLLRTRNAKEKPSDKSRRRCRQTGEQRGKERRGTSVCAPSSRGSWRNFQAESAVVANDKMPRGEKSIKRPAMSLFSFLYSSRYVRDIRCRGRFMLPRTPLDVPASDLMDRLHGRISKSFVERSHREIITAP